MSSQHGTISDVIKRIRDRTLPMVDENAALDDLIDAFERSRHSRVLYVVDADSMYLGVIEVKDLSRHILFHYHVPRLSSSDLIHVATLEYAKDFIKKERCSAMVDEGFEEVLERMLENNADEIPLLSKEGKLLGDLTIVDMIDYYMHTTGRDRLGILP